MNIRTLRLAALFVAMLSVAMATAPIEGKEVDRMLVGTTPPHKPPPKNDGGSAGSGGSGESGGSSGSGESSGSGSEGSSGSDGSGSGGSGSGGSGGSSGGSGGSSGGGGGSSGGSGGSDGSDGTDAASAAENNKKAVKRKGFLLVAGAAVAGAIVAAAAMRKRKVETKAHPLTGVVTKRMQLFSTLAGKGDRGSRPAREVDIEMAQEYQASV